VKILEEENAVLKGEVRVLRDQKEEAESSLSMFEQEIDSRKDSIEKRAELSVDERFKAKHEAIKCYFDSHLTKLLLNTGLPSDPHALSLGREILALKLLSQKLES
jgi:hypothetical protein